MVKPEVDPGKGYTIIIIMTVVCKYGAPEMSSVTQGATDMLEVKGLLCVLVLHCRGISMYRVNDVVEMAMKGIPEKYRAEIWMIYSGIFMR